MTEEIVVASNATHALILTVDNEGELRVSTTLTPDGLVEVLESILRKARGRA